MKNRPLIVVIITVIIWMVNISAITMDASTSGKAWSNTEVVSAEITKYAYRAILAVDESGNVHIAWKDQTNYSNAGSDWDVFYKKKTIDGNWTETEVVSTDNNGNCGCPALAVDKNTNVYIVWSDFTNYSDSGDDMDVFYKMKTLDGYWMETEVVSTESTGDSWRPSVAVDLAGTIHVIWEEMTYFNNSSSDWDIFYKKKTLDGNWTEAEVVSTESNRDTNWPSIAVDHNGTIYIVWKDKTTYDVSGYDGDIFYKKKTLDGNWTEIELVSVESKNDSNWPSIAVDASGIVHVSWWDEIASEKWPAEKWVVLYNFKYIEDEQPIFYDEEPDGEDYTDDDRIDSIPGFEFLLILFSFVIIFLIKSRKHP